MPRILLISNYHFGTTSSLLAAGFEAAGCTVDKFSPSPDLPSDWSPCNFKCRISNLINRLGTLPDLVLFCEATTGTQLFPLDILSCPAPTAFYAIDNHLNFGWHRLAAPLFDLVFCAQHDYQEAFRESGCECVHWLPFGWHPPFHQVPTNPPIRSGVGFVGQMHSSRKEIFQTLARQGVSVDVRSGPRGSELGDFYRCVKIVLNFSINGDLNMRAFEALASGALLVTQRIKNGIEKLLLSGEHFVFHDGNNCASVVRYYLDNDSERERIAANGERKVRSLHRYEDRARSVLELLPEARYRAAIRQKKPVPWWKQISLVDLTLHPTFSRWHTETRREALKALKANPLQVFPKILGRFVRQRMQVNPRRPK